MKEKTFTTRISEQATTDIAREINTITPVTYADVRGRVEQDTDHLPISKNGFTKNLFTPEDFRPSTPNTQSVDSEEITHAVTEISPDAYSRSLTRGLGKVAILPFATVRKINEFSAYASLEAMTRLPMLKSREEILEARRARMEKYTTREGDSRMTRFRKYIGRNAIKASAWSMTGITAAVAASPLLRHITEIPTVHTEIAEIADITVLVGGRGDKTGDGAQNMLAGTGLLTGKLEKIQYPAGVSPLLGDQATSDQSAAIAAPQILDIVNKNRGKTIDVVSYSNGTLATDLAEKTIRQQNGGQLQEGMRSIKLGAPAAPDTGVLQNQFIGGVAQVFGVSKNTPTNGSNTIYITNSKDLYGNGVNPSLNKVIGSLSGKDHDYSQATVGNASATTTRASNGATAVTLGIGERTSAPSKPGRSAMMDAVDKVAPAGKKPANTQEYVQPVAKNPAPINVQHQSLAPVAPQKPTLPVAPRLQAPISNETFLQQIHAQRNRTPQRT